MAAPQRQNRPGAGAPTRSSRNVADSERVFVDLGGGEIVRMTLRAAKKTKLKQVDAQKGKGHAWKLGFKGTKSIVLQYGAIKTVNKKRPTKGQLYAIPVPGKFKIDDYIRVAKEAKADAFFTPDGRRYPVHKTAAPAGPARR